MVGAIAKSLSLDQPFLQLMVENADCTLKAFKQKKIGCESTIQPLLVTQKREGKLVYLFIGNENSREYWCELN